MQTRGIGTSLSILKRQKTFQRSQELHADDPG